MSSRVNADNVRLKRAYEPPTQSDGTRVLVDRLWPRGLKKVDAARRLLLHCAWGYLLGSGQISFCAMGIMEFNLGRTVTGRHRPAGTGGRRYSGDFACPTIIPAHISSSKALGI